MKASTIIHAILPIGIIALSGCTLLEVESTKTEAATPVTGKTEQDQDLKNRVTELEQRVKALEEKLQGQW